MDSGDAARLEDAQQVGNEIIHLDKEIAIAGIVAEILILCGIFVMVTKRYTGMNQADTVRWYILNLDNTVIIDGRELGSFDFHFINSYFSLQITIHSLV